MFFIVGVLADLVYENDSELYFSGTIKLICPLTTCQQDIYDLQAILLKVPGVWIIKLVPNICVGRENRYRKDRQV